MEKGDVEAEVFGSQDAFSIRWTDIHGLPHEIPANPSAGVNRPFSPADVFSEIAETGLTNQPTWYRASLAIETAPDKKFRVAAQNGLLKTLALDNVMKAGRMDSVANLLKDPALGLTPQGIAQWLLVDDETRRSLALIFRLQGYNVPDEKDASGNPVYHDRVAGLRTDGSLPGQPKFSEYVRYGADGKPQIIYDHIKDYLRAVQEAVGTDRGVTRIAYTIFRALGFPHENAAYARFVGENINDPRVGLKGDLALEDIAPFMERYKIPGLDKTLKQIVEEDGVLGMARALHKIPAEQLARDWDDLNTTSGAMGELKDIRKGIGGAAAIGAQSRLEQIKKLEKLNILLAKRRLSQETVERIFDFRKISTAPAALAPSVNEQLTYGLRDLLGGLGKRKPPVKGE